MPPPPVLKKRHTLKGKNIFPLVKKVRNWTDEMPTAFARTKMNVPMEALTDDDICTAIRQITTESEKDLLEMAGKDVNHQNLRLLLHCVIIYANEHGEPDGQMLEEHVVSKSAESETAPPLKKQKTETTLERRIMQLEAQAKQDGEATVQAAKEKVRCLALQSEPSEPLLLVSLEELAKCARKYNDSEATVYEELYRQANLNRAKIDVADFTLNVLGGKASDVVTKALSKCIKTKPVAKGSEGPKSSGEISEAQSPLANLYGATGLSMPQMIPSQYQPYGYFPFQGYQQGYRRFRPSYRGQTPARGVCHFCDTPGHLMKDCVKMKEAKAKLQ